MATVWVDVTGFHCASIASTVTVNAACAVWVDGVPVRPVGEPGTEVSPGTSTSSRLNAPALTVMLPLVPVFEEPATLTVWVPAVFSVAPPANVRVPLSAEHERVHERREGGVRVGARERDRARVAGHGVADGVERR